MHQCVSLAHLGSCSPGSTGLGCNVSVKVRVRVELMRVGVRPAVATSHFIRPQSVSARLSLQQTPADRSTVNAYSIVGLKVSLWGRGDYISLIWVKIQVAGWIRGLKTCTFAPYAFTFFVHTHFYDVNALTVHSVDRPIRGRKTETSIGRAQFASPEPAFIKLLSRDHRPFTHKWHSCGYSIQVKIKMTILPEINK